MRNNLINAAIAAAMTILFAMTFWTQVRVIASAAGRVKTETTQAVTSNPYLPIQMLEPVY